MAARLYRMVLRILPASFRHEYGDQMAEDFVEQHRDAGFIGRALLWLEAFPDIVAASIREHSAVMRQDLRHALRTFRRTPGYPLTAIVIVALGVGANTAIFTVVDHALVRPLPFDEPDRLVQLWESVPVKGYMEVEPSPATYDDWVAQNRVFSDLAAYASVARNLTGGGVPERISGSQVTSALFSVLGVEALRGRTLLAEDDGVEAPEVVLLTYGFWQRRFGGDTDIVGQRINLDGIPHEIVGVMPAAFRFPQTSAEYWIPLRMGVQDRTDRSNHFTMVIGRLKDGVTLEQSRAEMNLIAERMGEAYPETHRDSAVLVRTLREQLSQDSRFSLILLLSAAAGVLLIGCANLSNLLMARSGERRTELAVRAALGAGTDRLVRQILTENLLLAFSGGLLGVGLAHLMLPVLGHLIPDDLPIGGSLAIDGRILIFGIAVSILTGGLFAMIPAWHLSRQATASGLSEGGRGGSGSRQARTRNVLLIIEVAVSVVLLIGAGLLVRALSRVSSLDPGFRTEKVLTMRTPLPNLRYPERVDRERFYDEVLSRVRALPNVKRAGYTGFLPFVMRGIVWPVGIDRTAPSDGESVPLAVFREVTEGYLETLGVNVTSGRGFDSRDRVDSQKIAVVSESFADQMWPDQNPVGRDFNFLVPWMPDAWTVAGVVPDIRARGLERRPLPQVYLLHRQMTVASFHAPRDLAVQFEGDERALVPALRQIVWDVDPELPISDVQSIEDLLASETVGRRFQLRLLGVFTGLAFVMAALGIYGVLSFLVSRRNREIGVRMALGARSIDVLRLVLAKGLTLTAVGLVIGVLGGLALGQTMRGLLFGVNPFDPSVLAASAGLCFIASVVACWIPARRAARVDPMTAVRAE